MNENTLIPVGSRPNQFLLQPPKGTPVQKFKKGELVELIEDVEIINYSVYFSSDVKKFPKGTRGFVKKFSKKSYEIEWLTEGSNTVPEINLKKYEFVPKTDWDKVILPKEIKEKILATISQDSNHKKIFNDWGFDFLEKGKGISLLFAGLPGTGKTLMAQAIADYLRRELLYLKLSEARSKWWGESEKFITAKFKEAMTLEEKGFPVVLLLDECDALLSSRNFSQYGWESSEINNLLVEIENFTGVLILTTNRIGILDEALERRISLKLEFPFPDEELREKIWRALIPEKCPISKEVDFKELAQYKIAGGNIKNVILNAARAAAYEGQTQLTPLHFKLALKTELEAKKQFKGEYDS